MHFRLSVYFTKQCYSYRDNWYEYVIFKIYIVVFVHLVGLHKRVPYKHKTGDKILALLFEQYVMFGTFSMPTDKSGMR